MRKQGAELERVVQMQSSPVTLILDGYRLRLKHNREPAYLQSLAEEAQQRIAQLRASVQMPESRWVHLVSLLLLLDELKGAQAQCVELQQQLQSLQSQQVLSSLAPSVGEQKRRPSRIAEQEGGSAFFQNTQLGPEAGGEISHSEASSDASQREFPPFGLSDSIRDRQRTLFAYLPVRKTDET